MDAMQAEARVLANDSFHILDLDPSIWQDWKGFSPFIESSLKLAYGSGFIEEHRASMAALQVVGGCGGGRLAFELCSKLMPTGPQVFMSVRNRRAPCLPSCNCPAPPLPLLCYKNHGFARKPPTLAAVRDTVACDCVCFSSGPDMAKSSPDGKKLGSRVEKL